MEDDYAHPYEAGIFMADISWAGMFCSGQDSIEKFTTYEDYLDSQITPQDWACKRTMHASDDLTLSCSKEWKIGL